MSSLSLPVASANLNGSLLWSCEIPAIACTVPSDTESVRVSVSVGGVTIFSDSLWRLGSGVSVSPMRMVMEEMEAHRMAMAAVRIRFQANEAPVDVNFTAIFSRRRISSDAATFISENFLSLAKVRRLPEGWTDTVWLITEAGESREVIKDVTYADAEGRYQTMRVTSALPTFSSRTVWGTTVSWPELPEGCFPLAMAFRVGRRVMTWYRHPYVNLVFRYRNAFGVSESLAVRGSVASKLSVKGQLARIAAKLVRYDLEETEEITVTFPPSASDDMQFISQIASGSGQEWARVSGGVRPDSSGFTPIVIESAEFKDDEDPQELPHPELTFRPCDPTPGAVIPAAGGVFTQPFTDPFS